VKSPLPLLSVLYHHPSTLFASPIDQRIYKNILGYNHLDLLDRWIQTHQLAPVAKPDLVYLQVRTNVLLSISISVFSFCVLHRHHVPTQLEFMSMKMNG